MAISLYDLSVPTFLQTVRRGRLPRPRGRALRARVLGLEGMSIVALRLFELLPHVTSARGHGSRRQTSFGCLRSTSER